MAYTFIRLMTTGITKVEGTQIHCMAHYQYAIDQYYPMEGDLFLAVYDDKGVAVRATVNNGLVTNKMETLSDRMVVMVCVDK